LEEAISEAARNNSVLSAIRQYHFSGTYHVWDNAAYVDEVVVKQGNHLVNRHGNVPAFIQNTSRRELEQPVREQVNGIACEVSMFRPLRLFNNSPFQFISHYLKLTDQEIEGLRPYHVGNATRGTFDDEEMVTEVIIKKIDSLLERKYDNDLTALVQGMTETELKEPFIEVLGEHPFIVSPSRAVAHMGNHMFECVCKYIESYGVEREYWGIRPFHLHQASKHTYPALADEVLWRKARSLLPKYGDVDTLLEQARMRDDLLTPFTDQLAGRPVTVSMAMVGHELGTREALITRLRAVLEETPIIQTS